MGPRACFIAAAAAGTLAVVCGAFAAHVLASTLEARALETVDTAVRYHLAHAVALAATGVALLFAPDNRGFRFAAAAFCVGIVLFSGSLYGIALAGAGWLGPVTPIGGMAFIGGWIGMGVGGWALRDPS